MSIFLLTSCKRDVAGCNDSDAINFSKRATLNDGSCKYPPCILNRGFESINDPEWDTYAGTWFSPFAYITSVNDGFMPTEGKNYFKCTPTIYYSFGTYTRQYTNTIKHCKGFYFDCSYVAIARSDSILRAAASVRYTLGSTVIARWDLVIDKNAETFNGFPELNVKSKDIYVELPYSEGKGIISVDTKVTSGTFTFCVDNFREVKR